MDEAVKNDLIESARKAWENAYAPYSNFKVGSAVLTESGDIFAGCNVESASYGLAICAERNAIAAAVAQGNTRIEHIAVFADTDTLTSPCGACRQVIWEFGGDIPVTLSNADGKTETLQMKDLLPMAFDKVFLK